MKAKNSAEFEFRIADGLLALGDDLATFRPAPPSTDRAFWDHIAEASQQRLIAAGEAALTTEWPALSAKAYRGFTHTGDRIGYETPYFARRRKLNALVIAEAVEAQGRFLDAVIDGIYLICEESGWQLPAHNTQERGGVHQPLPDPTRPVIDLFAAETGALLAVVAAVLGNALDAVSAAIVQRIDHEIETRITRPYLNRHFWWMGNGDEPMNNWTAWCTQNVLLSTFTRPTNQQTRRDVMAKAAHSLDAFLKDYGDDGACDEGAAYYRHAALCLFGALRVMDAVAPQAFSFVWQAQKLRNMAEFILETHVQGSHYINFADASVVLEPCGVREFLFGKAVGSEPLCALAAADAATDPAPDLPEEINLFYRLLAISTAVEMASFRPKQAPKRDIYYPSCGLFIARDEHFVVAAKAGDNGDGHNHNDVGSVTVFKNGRPLLIDVGVETYTAKTFSARRYEIWTMQSGFHNLPTFEGIQQQAGPDFAADEVAVELGEAVSSISMNIVGAYPKAAGVAHYRRIVRLIKGGGVEIWDDFVGERQAELSLMLSEVPRISGGRMVIGDLADLVVAGAGPIRVEEITITDPRLRRAWPERLYRVLVPIEGRQLRLKIQ
ncbi:heparinase II/III family protein [Devosia sp.]|uniref:heparinase II/III domain-containing protein n=1 Tax=Devosia sp. TaxID=1871048 RepID=UPI003265AEEA